VKKKKKRKKNIGGFLALIGMCLLGLLIGTVIFAVIWLRPASLGDRINTMEQISSNERLEKTMSILLVGADKRPGDTFYNTDTIIIATVDPNTQVFSTLSILRDTRIRLNGSDVKINSLVSYGGIERLLDEVTAMTGIPLDGYMLTNFDGFKDIIDTVGGIDIYVEKDMYFETGDYDIDGIINLKEGQQVLNGWEALQYARFRNDALADVSRSARQQKVLKAIVKKCMSPSTITKIPALIPQINAAVETNISAADMLRLAKAGMAFEFATVISQTLPGNFLDLGGISYWEVDRTTARLFGQNILLGITSDSSFDDAVLSNLDAETSARANQSSQAGATNAETINDTEGGSETQISADTGSNPENSGTHATDPANSEVGNSTSGSNTAGGGTGPDNGELPDNTTANGENSGSSGTSGNIPVEPDVPVGPDPEPDPEPEPEPEPEPTTPPADPDNGSELYPPLLPVDPN
jgi:LCP family protein required for cell wall assembly